MKKKSKQKRNVFKSTVAFLCTFLAATIPFTSVFATLTVTGVQYGETYYAGLSKQYDRLTSINAPKVIVVGGSNVAFGLDSELFEQNFGMPSVCFGLYGSLGVKVMMDISKANINKGDIVVLAPETQAEGYSLYFGAESVLKATEGRLDIISHVAFDNYEDILGAAWGFATTKLQNARTDEHFDLTGVYQNKNINAYGEVDKVVFPREGNILATGYLQEAINLDPSGVTDEFVDYVNNYVTYCSMKGASVYFSFAPMNERAIDGTTLREDCDALYACLTEKLSCPVISDPMDYIYDYRYFYDTNFHLNDDGVVLRTAQLIRDLKRERGDSSKTKIELPAPPAPIFQQKDIDLTLDYTSSDLFEYSEEDGFLSIVGVKDSAKEEVSKMTSITLPVVHDNKYIVSIRKGALKDLTSLEVVTVPVGYTQIDNAVFEGCTSLKKIRILEKDPENIAVFDNLMEDAPATCKICVINGTASNFGTGYFWRRYVDYLVTGEGN